MPFEVEPIRSFLPGDSMDIEYQGNLSIELTSGNHAMLDTENYFVGVLLFSFQS